MMKRLWTAWFCLLAALSAAADTLDVTGFGARGDGVADDRAAIADAVAALPETGGVLYFPKGSYRIAVPGEGGLVLRQRSDVTVRFAEGAELLMDNLLSDGSGGGHGVLVQGPAKNIVLENVAVNWKTLPATRSFGDGFRFEGRPESGRSIDGVKLLHCRTARSPQAGALLQGVENVVVRDFRVTGNRADGLHFNACRNLDIDGVEGIDTGDDTLAFVTYFKDPDGSAELGFRELTDWNNSHARATRIRSSGGNANGVRIAGARDVRVADIEVEGKSCGVILDSGAADGKRFLWSYLPSREVEIVDLKARHCDSGVLVWCFSPERAEFTEFGIEGENWDLSDNRNDNFHVWDAAHLRIRNLRASNGRIRLRGFRDLQASGWELKGNGLVIQSRNEMTPDHSDLGPCDSSLDGLSVSGGPVLLQNTRAFSGRDWKIDGAPGSALLLQSCEDIRLSGVSLAGFAAENRDAAALLLAGCARIDIDALEVIAAPAASPSPVPLEVGGGSPAFRPADIAVAGELRGAFAPVRLQTGEFAPQHLRLELSEATKTR